MEIIKATLITKDNFETIKSLLLTQDISGQAVRVGNWFVCLTVKSDAIFPDLGGHVIQYYYVVTEIACFDYLNLVGEPTGLINSYTAERKSINHNIEVKDLKMARCPMTVGYVLFMIDRYGSRTHNVLMEYERTHDEIMDAYAKAELEDCLEHDTDPKTPHLTDTGRQKLREYYGNDFNGYDD